jgi:uncharacterized membrane protein
MNQKESEEIARTSVITDVKFWNRTCWTTVAYACFLFLWSAYRHNSFRSEAFDLGIFDQALWLISQGEVPYSTLLHRHILGDHFSLILYPLAVLYKIYPSVYWLFFIQAISLSFGAPLLYLIARRLNADSESAWFVVIAYLCHPIITNSNLYDFHPECLAVPLILGAVLCALKERLIPFFLLILLAISCKEVIALTIFGLGLVFLTPVFMNTRKAGIFAVLLGLASFFIISLYLLPAFNVGNAGSAGIERYGPPGLSVSELFIKYLTDPMFLISRLHITESLKYLRKLLLPYFFALSPGNLWVLVGAVPAFLLNCLSDLSLQRTIRFHYTLPLLPFLGLMVAIAVSRQKLLFKNKRLLTWGLVLYLTVPIIGAFIRPSSEFPHPWKPFPEQHLSLKTAISMIPQDQPVMVPSYIVAQLSHRKQVFMLKDPSPRWGLENVKFLMLNTQNPGWLVTRNKVEELIKVLRSPSYAKKAKLIFSSNDVYLFELSGI